MPPRVATILRPGAAGGVERGAPAVDQRGEPYALNPRQARGAVADGAEACGPKSETGPAGGAPRSLEEELLEPERGRVVQLPHLADREQHAWHEGLAGDRVVAD